MALPLGIPLGWRENGGNDIAKNLNGSTQGVLRIADVRRPDRNQLSHGLSALRDGDALPRKRHLVEEREAAGFEVGRVDALHLTSLTGQLADVKGGQVSLGRVG